MSGGGSPTQPAALAAYAWPHSWRRLDLLELGRREWNAGVEKSVWRVVGERDWHRHGLERGSVRDVVAQRNSKNH